MEKVSQVLWDSGSQRYILNSVTRSGHIPAVQGSSNGIFRDGDENNEDGPRADSVWHVGR